MKKSSFLIVAGLLLLVSSCKNTTKEETSESTTTEVTVTAPPAFTPFKLLMVRNTVKDYSKWKAVYMSKDSLRAAYGMSSFIIGRGMPDSNSIIVFDKLSDLEKGKAFTASPALKEAMKSAGTSSAPMFNYIDVIRSDDSKIDSKDRIMVMHKVKDFNVWLKAYDAEGKDTRAQFGMVDRGLGRGSDDSNMVYIVFAVTDMVKAKARGASPELKKIMMDAGVIGQPTMINYRIDQ